MLKPAGRPVNPPTATLILFERFYRAFLVAGAHTARPPLEYDVDKHVPLFKLRLVNGQSIGPLPLRNLWSRACHSDNVSVSRQMERLGTKGQTSYLLHGPANMADLNSVEARLRVLVDDSKLLGSISALHH